MGASLFRWGMRTFAVRVRVAARTFAGAAIATATLMAATHAQDAAQGQGTAPEAFCGVRGTVTGLGTPLPGASVSVGRGDEIARTTSTAADGTYRVALPTGDYRIVVSLPGFDPSTRAVSLRDGSCAEVVDLTLPLAAGPGADPPAGATARGAGEADGRPVSVPRIAVPGGFQSLPITTDETARAGAPSPGLDPDTTPFLPPAGFGLDASADVIAISGSAAQIDRGVLNERQQAVIRGDISLTLADLAVALGNQEGGFAGGLAGGFVGAGGSSGRLGDVLQQAGLGSVADLAMTFQQAGVSGRAGGPGGGGRGVVIVGGPGRVNMTADYTFGGSLLDASPYSLRGDARDASPYTRQTFGGTIGGPLRIPGLYANADNRTNFTLTYNGGRGSTLFDQYATVPTAEMRSGDFSASAVPLIDPFTGQPFPDNRIPADRISPQAQALLPWFPLPNLEGSARNYRHTASSASLDDGVSLRVTHRFTQGAGPVGGGGGGGRGMMVAIAGPGGPAGLGGGAPSRTNVVLNAQLQVNRSESDRRNVFDTIGGTSRSTSIGLPVSLFVMHGRNQHAFTFNLSHTGTSTRNGFGGLEHVTANAGIQGVSDDPFGWGLPALSFSSLSNLRDLAPSRRTDRRVSTEYRLSRAIGRHGLQLGGDVRFDRGSSYSDAFANGAFVFTGLYTTGSLAPHSGYDFADFLLGLPQQASVQYGPGNVSLSGRAMSLYFMDDWRPRANLTLNAGLRYEVLWPWSERHGNLVNLDVGPDFSGAAPVVAGGTGPFSGDFPDALVRTDLNNVAPRVGVAWRTWRDTVVRGGYGVSYNAGGYQGIARQMASQPPFAVTNTQIGSLTSLLLMEQALLGGTPEETRNSFGVDRNYVLGTVQTWNVDVSRNLTPGWAAGASYTHTRGSNLDVVRAPNRDADGNLRIDGVQPFTWQTSEGASVLHSGTFRLDRRQIRGIGGRVQYTLAQSRDNSPSIGGFGNVVAQDDRDIEAEWGRSNFDQRHRLATMVTAELPFGPNRRWLRDGAGAALLQGWRLSATFSATSGSPLTARVSGAARDVASGISGALRADLTGEPIALSDPTVDQFFNTAAFAVPEPGMFGTSGRNVITGPGATQLDAQVARDLFLGGNRTMSMQLRASNLLNTVNYATVDTVVNSPTFGQVLGARPMRSVTLTLRFRY